MYVRRNRYILQIIISIVILGVLFYVSSRSHPTHQSTTSKSQSSATQTVPVQESTSATCHMHGLLPDAICTPGATNPSVTQDNIQQTICISGYTKTIRPPATYTDKLKVEQMQSYGFTDDIHNHEEDHLISLELGGAPSDPHNLWPEPGNSPNPKDKVEDFLHKAVCDGHITLQEAQSRIATDWTTAENGIQQ
jgi:hypothetical protein